MLIGVTGATGLIGCHAVAQLARDGHRVRALVRGPRRLDSVLAPFGDARAVTEAVEADLADPAGLQSALSGCEGLIHAAGVFSHDRADAARLEAVNVEGTRAVLEAARACGIGRIVTISSMLALFPPSGTRMTADDPVRDPGAMYSATKARAERIARREQEAGLPVTIIYPSSVQGPHDPTLGSGPAMHADALRQGQVLVTEGGLAYTDVRDLARLLARLFEPSAHPARIMAPSFYLEHAALHTLMESLTGRSLRAARMPGWMMRAMGRVSDWSERWVGRGGPLTFEAANVLTRSVPVDDDWARSQLTPACVSPESSFRDLFQWMAAAGHLSPAEAGDLAGPRDPAQSSPPA